MFSSRSPYGTDGRAGKILNAANYDGRVVTFFGTFEVLFEQNKPYLASSAEVAR